VKRGRILIVSSDVPWPADGGGRIASLRVVEASARQYEVDLLALADPFRELDLTHLLGLCRRLEIIPHPFTLGRHRIRQTVVAARSVFSPEPYRLRKFRSSTMQRRLNEWKADGGYDLIHHEQFGTAQYRDARLPSTILVQNVESEIYRLARHTQGVVGRAWAIVEGAKLARREPRLLADFDEVLVLSEHDRTLLAEVDVDRVSVVPMPAPQLLPWRKPGSDPVVLTLGSMSWFGVADGLRWFHDSVLPLIRAQLSAVRWELVGPGAPAAVRSYAEEPGIRLHGYVDDLSPIIKRSRVAVVPLRVAGGIRMKLLDLMAWGVPAVATHLGAQGLSFADGDGCFRENDPVAFADSVVRLLTDDELWLNTVRRGRDYLAAHHGPGDIDVAIASSFDRAIHRHAVGSAG
jgi:glycosyltransferase involved in cell wall biosynthesis